MQKQRLIKLAYFISPLVFIGLYFWKGEFCIMNSCSGSNAEGMVYGLAGALAYIVGVKLLSKERMKIGFLFICLIIILVLTYYFGKMNASI